ncbi:MAG: WD40 repeat domain-containing protein [Armatimonadota bacterium]
MTIPTRRALGAALVLAVASHAQAQRPAPKPAAKSVRPAPAAPGVRAALPPAWSVAFSPDSNRLAIGGYRSVTVWSVNEGTKAAQWEVTKDAVRALAYSPDGRYLAVGGGAPGVDGVLLLLDARTGQTVRSIPAHEDTVEAVAFAGDVLLSAGDDERVVLTEIATGKKVGSLTEHVGRCLAVAVPLRTSEGSGGAIFATGGDDKMVKIWDAELRRVVVNFDQSGGPVWAVAPFPQPGRFAAAGGDGSVRLFQVRADRPGGANPDDPGAANKPETGLDIKVVLRKGEPAPRTGALAATLTGHNGPVYAVAVARNGNWIASGGADRKVVVWNGAGGRVREHTEATSDIWGLAISPNSRWLAASSRDGKVRVYDLADGTLAREFPPPPKGIAK